VYSDFLTIDDINMDDCRLWSLSGEFADNQMSLSNAKFIFRSIHYEFLKILDYEDKLKQQRMNSNSSRTGQSKQKRSPHKQNYLKFEF
jgi:hypothetical protein